MLWFGLEAWRWMFLAGIVPGLVYGIVASRLPESPRYLMMKGNEARARAVLETIRPGHDVDAELTAHPHRDRQPTRRTSPPPFAAADGA